MSLTTITAQELAQAIAATYPVAGRGFDVVLPESDEIGVDEVIEFWLTAKDLAIFSITLADILEALGEPVEVTRKEDVLKRVEQLVNRICPQDVIAHADHDDTFLRGLGMWFGWHWRTELGRILASRPDQEFRVLTRALEILNGENFHTYDVLRPHPQIVVVTRPLNGRPAELVVAQLDSYVRNVFVEAGRVGHIVSADGESAIYNVGPKGVR